MTKPLPEMTEKQLAAAFAKARAEYGRRGSIASILRLEAVEAEIARRVAA